MVLIFSNHFLFDPLFLLLNFLTLLLIGRLFVVQDHSDKRERLGVLQDKNHGNSIGGVDCHP